MKKSQAREKVSMSLYLTPRGKQKLECLQQLYFVCGKRFSLSEIVEEAIGIIYAAAYLCQNSKFWRTYFLANRFVDSSEASTNGIDEVLDMVQKKPLAAKELLQVEINVKKNFVDAFSEALSDKAEVLKKKFFKSKPEEKDSN